MWDASAKQAVGLLSGNRYQLGDFDECLQVTTPINAQYCLVDIKLDVPSEYSYTDPLAREYDPLLPAWHKIYVSLSKSKVSNFKSLSNNLVHKIGRIVTKFVDAHNLPA